MLTFSYRVQIDCGICCVGAGQGAEFGAVFAIVRKLARRLYSCCPFSMACCTLFPRTACGYWAAASGSVAYCPLCTYSRYGLWECADCMHATSADAMTCALRGCGQGPFACELRVYAAFVLANLTQDCSNTMQAMPAVVVRACDCVSMYRRFARASAVFYCRYWRSLRSSGTLGRWTVMRAAHSWLRLAECCTRYLCSTVGIQAFVCYAIDAGAVQSCRR